MSLPPICSHLSTGDVGLASCLNVVGIPPAPDHQLRVVKNADGSDFCRIALGSVSLDGRTETAVLMDRWAKGADGVRSHRATPFAMLQVWNKTRVAMFKMREDKVIVKGLCGGWNIMVESHDVAKWIDPGTAWEFRGRHVAEPFFTARDAGLAAALVVLDCELMGVDASGGWVFSRKSLDRSKDGMECAMAWPSMLADTTRNSSYMAAAAQQRNVILQAIKDQDPDLMFSRGRELGFLSERKYNEGERGALEIARKLGI